MRIVSEIHAVRFRRQPDRDESDRREKDHVERNRPRLSAAPFDEGHADQRRDAAGKRRRGLKDPARIRVFAQAVSSADRALGDRTEAVC